MMFAFKVNFLKIFLLLILFLPNIQSDCVIQYPSDIDTVPKYEKFIGNYKLRIPYNGKNIILFNGETVQGFCETYFSPITYEIEKDYEEYEEYDFHKGYRRLTKTVTMSIVNQTSITINCHDNELIYSDKQVSKTELSCVPSTWSIYSTKNPYSWCKKNQNSSTFLLAAKSMTTIQTLGAICFNMEQISLQAVVLNTTNFRPNHINQPIAIDKSDIDENLWNFKITTLSDLSNENLQKKIMELGKTDEWLNLANYEISSIVQDKTLNKYLKEFENILNIIWWRNLRLGNWKRFVNTLANYAHNNSYELYTGTSGVAKYPTDDQCIKEKLLELNLGFKNETVPAYIWTYLRSFDHLNKEFIIVGYNSPYTEYFTIEKVIFCPDICSEIPWLNEISSSFRHTFGGIMFCCSTDFIRQTNYLQGFPMDVLLASDRIETTVKTTSVDEYTTERFTKTYEPSTSG